MRRLAIYVLATAFAAALGLGAVFVQGMTAGVGVQPPGTPAPIICTTTCSAAAIQVGQTLIVKKAGVTSRSSSVAITDDPDLAITSLPIGNYTASAYVLVTLATTTTQGFKADLVLFNGEGQCLMRGAASPSVTPTTIANPITSPMVFASVTSINIADIPISMYCIGMSNPSSTQSFKLAWAQNASNANSTSVNGNSWLRIDRVQ